MAEPNCSSPRRSGISAESGIRSFRDAGAFDELRLGKAGDVVPSLFDAE